MALTTHVPADSTETNISDGLARLATLPTWLLAPLQPDRMLAALRRGVPEFASGALVLRAVKIKRLLLKDGGRWFGTYSLTLEEGGSKRAVALHGTLTPPALGAVAARPPGAFGSEGWRLALPELGLELVPEPPESELPALPRLTDPEQARALLEEGIRAGAHPDMRIAACRPEVLGYKPGSRCIIRYHLDYPPDLAGRGWPASVIAKTYRKESKARNAYDGMVALWRTPLAHGDVVAIAEPLAYIPELKVMVQGPVGGGESLEDMLKRALKTESPAALAEVELFMRKAAAGLAAFHRSGVRHGETVTLDERFDELAELIDRLHVGAPELTGAAEPLLARLRELAAACPAGALVPTHGTLSPEQVLIDGERVGLIDFDDFSMAEPALDVGLFRAAIKDIGMNGLGEDEGHAERQRRLELLDRIGEAFLAEYELHAPVARERVALWEAWSYFRDVLHFWTKAKPAEPENAMMMLTHHLRTIGVLPAA
jgi:hypothetical protein